jgi:hypothetical protein
MNEEKALLQSLQVTFDERSVGLESEGSLPPTILLFLMPLLQGILLILRYTGTVNAPYIQLCLPGIISCVLWAMRHHMIVWRRILTSDPRVLQTLQQHAELLSPDVACPHFYFTILPWYIIDPWQRYGLLLACLFMPFHADGIISGTFISWVASGLLAPWLLIIAFEQHGKHIAAWRHPFHARLHLFCGWDIRGRCTLYAAWVQLLLITIKLDGSSLPGWVMLLPAWALTAAAYVDHLRLYPKMFHRLESTYLRVIPSWIFCTSSFILWSLLLVEIGSRTDGYSILGFSVTEDRGRFFIILLFLWLCSSIAFGLSGEGDQQERRRMSLSDQAFALFQLQTSRSEFYETHLRRIHDCELKTVPADGSPIFSPDRSEISVADRAPPSVPIIATYRALADQLIHVGQLHHISCHSAGTACGCARRTDNRTAAAYVGTKISSEELHAHMSAVEVFAIKALSLLIADYWGTYSDWISSEQLWRVSARIFGRDIEVYSSEATPLMSRYPSRHQRSPLRLSEFKYASDGIVHLVHQSLVREIGPPNTSCCCPWRRLNWRQQGFCLSIVYVVFGLTLGLYNGQDGSCIIVSYILGIMGFLSCLMYQNWKGGNFECMERRNPRLLTSEGGILMLNVLALLVFTLVVLCSRPPHRLTNGLIILYMIAFVGNLLWLGLSKDSAENAAVAIAPLDVVVTQNYGSTADISLARPAEMEQKLSDADDQKPLQWKEVLDDTSLTLFDTPKDRCLYLWCDWSRTNPDSNYEPGCTSFRLVRMCASLWACAAVLWTFIIWMIVAVHAPTTVQSPITNTFNNTVPSPFLHQPWSYMMNPQCQHPETMQAFYQLTVLSNQTSCWPQPLYADGCTIDGHGLDGYFYPMLFLVIIGGFFVYFYLLLGTVPVIYDAFLHPPRSKRCDCGSGIVKARPNLRNCGSPVFTGFLLLIVGVFTFSVFTGSTRNASDIRLCAPRLQNGVSVGDVSWDSYSSGCFSRLSTYQDRQQAAAIAQDCPGTVLDSPSESTKLFVQLTASNEVCL